MNTLSKVTFSLILGCALTLNTHADDAVATEGAEVGKWTMDFEAAKKLAAEKELPMLLNFTGSDWCGWCKLMDGKVFAEAEWKTYAAENVVLVTLDFPKDKSIVPEKYVAQNEKLKGEFGIRGYPTYVVLDSDGETQIGQLGASREATPEAFIKQFKAATRMSAASIKAYSEANPDKAEAFKAAIAEEKALKEEVDAWIATRPEQNEENNKKFAAFKDRMEAVQKKLETFQ